MKLNECKECKTEFSGRRCPICGKMVKSDKSIVIIILSALVIFAIIGVFQLMRKPSANVIESKLQLKTEAQQRLEEAENVDEQENEISDSSAESQEEPQTESEAFLQALQPFVLNTKTHTFHLPGCSAAKKINAENSEEKTCTSQELIEQGYKPCGICAKEYGK